MKGKKSGVIGYTRAGTQVRYFDAAEDDEITVERISGLSIRCIAKNVGRSPSSVYMRLQALAIAAEMGDT